MNKHTHTHFLGDACGCVYLWLGEASTHTLHVLTAASYMKLEDIASRFRKPCIMDIKVWSLTPHTLSHFTLPTPHFSHTAHYCILHLTV